MLPDAALLGLFVSAFVSSTLLPGSSEIVMGTLVVQRPSLFWTGIAVATAGNTLGGLTSYGLGRLVPRPKTQPRALAVAQRYGVAALLLSWLPVIGDALCVASGWLRHDLVLAILAIAAGKFARYVVLAAALRGFAS